MKKTIIYLSLILFAGAYFAACDDPYAGQLVAEPTINEQGPVLSADGFAFALGSGFGSAIVLTEEDLESTELMEAVTTTATPELSEGASLQFKLEMSGTQDFLNSVEIPSVSEGNKAYITAANLDEAVKNLYGLAPEARELFFGVTYTIVDDTHAYQSTEPVVLGSITVTPVGPEIELGYYLIGDLNDWNFANLTNYQFSHSDRDVYEDPFFTILVNNMQGNFKIVPQSSKDAADWSGVLGNTVSDGNTALEGTLVADGGAMRVEEPGWVKITLNMLEYTYSIEIIGEMNLTLYVPGGHQGWDPATAPTLYSRNFDFIYEGYVYFDAPNEFKFTSEPNWNGINYGDGGEGILSTDPGAGNLNINEAGYYQLKVDLSGSPYTYSAVKTDWGVIGDATQGSWDNSTPMVFNPGTGIWSVTTTLAEGDFKFRANNEWDINLGGNILNLGYDGENIKMAEAGTYLITLDLSDPTVYKATLTKQ